MKNLKRHWFIVVIFITGLFSIYGLNSAYDQPAENIWLKLKMAGLTMNDGKLEWAVGGKFKIKDIQEFKVIDITDSEEKVLINEEKPEIDSGEKVFFSDPIEINVSVNPWLFDGKTTGKTLKIILKNSKSKEMVMYQNIYLSGPSKNTLVKILGNLEKNSNEAPKESVKNNN